MGTIKDTIEVYERLRKYRYKITIQTGVTFEVRFSREHYHHLIGFQHLTDIQDIEKPNIKQKFYNDLRKGKVSEKRIKSSAKYATIEERINSFAVLEMLLEPGEGKIIVDFDKNKTDTQIEAKFHLFHRDGNPFKEKVSYYTLFLGRDKDGIYFPVTYLVEHSNMYVRNQEMYNCTIEKIPLK